MINLADDSPTFQQKCDHFRLVFIIDYQYVYDRRKWSHIFARPISQRNITQQPNQADEPMDYLMEVDPEVEEMELRHGYYF